MSLLSIPVSFTPLYSTNIKSIHINPNWTIKQLYDSISPIIKQLFHINEFVLIEIKSNNTNNLFPNEAYPHIEINNINTSTFQKINTLWTSKLNVSFYVKDLNIDYPQLYAKNILFQRDASCPICFESGYLCNRYGCTHYLCNNCYVRCGELSSLYNRCPICRQNGNNNNIY
uniref:RING-type domain-containing protein n=1 Tax=viral metagenome TaxID=1070528 RepID=A0A6C0ISP8_9ZZZZ